MDILGTQERFRAVTQEWLELNTDITECAAELKKMRDRLNNLRDEIMDYMTKNNINTVSLMDGGVMLTCSDRRQKIKPSTDEAIEKMSKYMGSRDAAEALYNHVWKDSCEVKVCKTLSKRCVQ